MSTKVIQTNMFDQAIKDKTEQYEKARAKVQAEIDSLERSCNQYDNGQGDVEDRRELNYLYRELEHLDQNYKEAIAGLKVQQNQK